MLNKKQYFIFIFLIFCDLTNAQTINFDIKSIPEDLRKNANKVVRLESNEFEVADIDYATLTVHRIITILNEGGKEALLFAEGTDKFKSLANVEIKLFDATGKMVGKYKERDLNSIGIAEGLIDDSKTYYLQLHATNFPVTVEYKYELRFKGLLNYPSYQFLEPDEGVEVSSYTARIQKDLGLRYKEKNIQLPPVISEDGKYQVYTWSVKNLTPVAYEENAVSYESRYPRILLAPNNFKLDNYEGNMQSWQNFGKWYGMLQQGAGVLPDDRVTFFKNLTKDARDDREKVKRLYEYLQRNFRYVSIQLGIGGYKPLSASFTDAKKYGDCKGLSNYMQAVLNAVGIKSYQALINAEFNQEPVDPSFPCNQFNHVIVCVPQGKDSIWLECTSRKNDFGTLGSSTENRNALLITENGGILVPTPRSKSSENIFNASTTIELKEDGFGKTRSTFLTTGEYKQDLYSLMDDKIDEQKDYIMHRWGFKDPDSINFLDDSLRNKIRLVVEQEAEKVSEFKTSNKMFLPPRIYSLWPTKLPKAENRRQDFYFSHPFEKSDTTIFLLPEGYKAEALPDARTSSCNYATYSCKCWYDEKNNAIYSCAKIILFAYKIPHTDYPMVSKFFNQILQDDLQRIIIKKNSP
jgi:transglutaminase-like putative cysteine protease